MTAFNNGPGDRWKATLLRSLENTATVLKSFGEEDENEVEKKDADKDVDPKAGQGSSATTSGGAATQPASMKGNEALVKSKGSASEADSVVEQSPARQLSAASSAVTGGDKDPATSSQDKKGADNDP